MENLNVAVIIAVANCFLKPSFYVMCTSETC